MPRPMRVVGHVVQDQGDSALFRDRERALQYLQRLPGHGAGVVENLVTETDAFGYALAWLRERLPYGLESLADDWRNNADDF